MDAYPALLAAGALTAYDSRRITQALHVRMRNAHADDSRAALMPFVQQVVADLRSGTLAPHPYAYVHLFGIFKDGRRFAEGLALWQWLAAQDERHVSQAAYGAALELMAYGGLARLPDLEALYRDALARFPGTFAEYHLSPDAIVPDRAQPTAVAGIPTMLLQGILTARILARDWKRAYLALDTALRLYPAQLPARYFELFMTERPVAEAYTAFLLACRAGVALRPTHVTALFTRLRAAIAASSSMADRMLLVRAIANALYAGLEAGAPLQSIHVGSLIHALEQLLPDRLAGHDYEPHAAELRNAIVAAAHSILSGLIQAGMSPQIHPFEALISLSGKLRVPGLLATTLQDVKTAGIDLGPIGTRSAVTSAGLVGNKELIELLWERLVTVAEAERAQIPFQDWITFTKACRRAAHTDYFRKQLLRLPHAITESIERHLIQQIDQTEPVPSDTNQFDYMSTAELTAEIDGLKSQMKSIEAIVMSGQPLNLRQNPFYMHLDPNNLALGSIDHLRAVYDEYTIDPHQPPLAPSAQASAVQPALSPTGIPLDELRFQNWVTVLEMMDDAEAYESDFQFALDAAIKAGTPLKGAPEVLRLRQDTKRTLRSAGGVSLRVKALRALSPSDVSIFRKIGSQVPDTKFKPMTYQANEKWAMRKTTKHSTLTHRERQAKQEETKGVPKLSYYVGLESHHDAPWKSKIKSPLGIQRLKLPPNESTDKDAPPANTTPA